MILAAVTLGFSTGAFCLGYCYPILGPIMLSGKNRSFKRSVIELGLFLLGRLTAYLVFGLLVGLFGRYLREVLVFHTTVLPSLFLVLGGIMVLFGFVQIMPHLGFCRFCQRFVEAWWSMLLVGFLAGLNLCPPFLLAAASAIELGNVASSILFFLFFFLATSLFLLPFIFSGLVARFKDVRSAARVTAVISGIWFIYQGLSRLL